MERSQNESALRTKLSLILGLTTSPFDGEVLAAARLANGLLDKHGLRWPDVLAQPRAVQVHKPAPLRWRELVAAALAESWRLSSWEKKFLSSLQRFAVLSPKQRNALDAIIAKLDATP